MTDYLSFSLIISQRGSSFELTIDADFDEDWGFELYTDTRGRERLGSVGYQLSPTQFKASYLVAWDCHHEFTFRLREGSRVPNLRPSGNGMVLSNVKVVPIQEVQITDPQGQSVISSGAIRSV